MGTATFRNLIFLLCPFCVTSCATVIEGPTARVLYEGAPGPLAFHDSTGRQIPSDHEFDKEEGLHYNYIELDKSQAEHIITARSGAMMQRDTLRRQFGYGWLLPDALFLYGLPVFAGVDILSSSIYSFTAPGIHLTKADTMALPAPMTLTLIEAEARRRAEQKLKFELHAGAVMPAMTDFGLPPAYGITAGYHFGSELWAALGYNYATEFKQRLGHAQRIYETELQSIEATVQYAPVKFAYLLAGFGFEHLIFQLASRPDDPEKRFARNLMTGSFGGGLYFGSLFLELRRNLPFVRIETPEGPGQYVHSTHLRGGVFVRL